MGSTAPRGRLVCAQGASDESVSGIKDGAEEFGHRLFRGIAGWANNWGSVEVTSDLGTHLGPLVSPSSAPTKVSPMGVFRIC